MLVPSCYYSAPVYYYFYRYTWEWYRAQGKLLNFLISIFLSFSLLLRLMVNLTNPTILLYDEALPKNKTDRNHFITITGHLQAYKMAFVDEEFWRVICTKLTKLIEVCDMYILYLLTNWEIS